MGVQRMQDGGVSRRSFLRQAGLRMAGVAASVPILTEAHLAWGAGQQQSAPHGTTTPRRLQEALPADAVLINANENPLGPCKAACDAVAAMAPLGGRYDLRGETLKLTKIFAQQNGLSEDSVAVYAGSSEPLHYAVLAFTSPERAYVTADPCYEAGMVAAAAAGAPVRKVNLTSTYAHDMRAMVGADARAGLIYVCNPNNPTGTLTPKEEIVWALEHKPAGSLLLVDEAYLNLSDAPDTLDLVKAGRELIVLRTFSKVYGMAGLRCGLALGRPDLLARLQPYGMNAMPITGSAAASVSLQEQGLVSARKKIIADTREGTFAWLGKNGYKYIPSVTNCFMIDTGRDGKSVIQAMRAKNVYIGRTWPVWPQHVRVSVGTPEEMRRFQVAFKEVMDAPSPAQVGALREGAPLFPHLS